jgi:hypothetical protein
MRGGERPAKIKWTRPFLAPLSPLSSSAALQTFIEVADDTHHEENVQQLLDLTGNLPLAISLIANVASIEGCDSALIRWKSQSTRMLSDGFDRISSLDISIMLSFTSSRMTPEAQQLLSILSMLPDGLTEADLLHAELPITDILICKTTLIRTSLAFVDRDRRLKVLVPIREHILHTHPPTNAMKLKLRQHFHDLLRLWNHFRYLNVADIVPQVSQNLGNFNSVLLDSISTECHDIIQNLQSILFLNHFSCRTQNTCSPLLPKISGQMFRWKSHPIFGDYLMAVFESSDVLPVENGEDKIKLGNEYFLDKAPLEQGMSISMFTCLRQLIFE